MAKRRIVVDVGIAARAEATASTAMLAANCDMYAFVAP